MFRKTPRMILPIAMAITLQGCHMLAAEGMSATGMFTPDDHSLQKSVAREYGVPVEAVVISDREVDGHLGSNTTYFTATIRGEARNCYITSAVFGIKSSPLCARPGESISSGDNALIRAAQGR